MHLKLPFRATAVAAFRPDCVSQTLYVNAQLSVACSVLLCLFSVSAALVASVLVVHVTVAAMMAIAHALIEWVYLSHSLSFALTHSHSCLQHDQCPAPGGAAYLSHFGCSTDHKQREEREQPHSHYATLSHSLSPSLSPVLLSRPRGRKTSFLITPRTTSFSSTPASSVAWLKGCCCRSTLYSLLSALHSPLAVLLFSFR